MAKRGAKPKPTHLKVVTGNPGKKSLPDNGAEIAIRETPLEPLKKLTVVEQRLWDRFINPAWWLTDFDVPKAQTWVCLKAEFLRSPKKMIASRVSQVRILENELGMDPGERARLGVADGKEKDKIDEFFD